MKKEKGKYIFEIRDSFTINTYYVVIDKLHSELENYTMIKPLKI